jgi:hypothetical protein
MTADRHIFISEFSQAKWGFNSTNSNVIHHGLDVDNFKPANIEREAVILATVNDWINRDWCCNYSGFQRITKNLPIKIVGETKGLSEACRSVKELIGVYQSHRIFINTSTVSPVPTSLLEAMSCGCACVSTATCMIPTIITHGVDGFISNDESELRGYCQLLLKDKELAQKLGNAARRTILDKFSEQKFIDNWNRQFDGLRNFVYKG